MKVIRIITALLVVLVLLAVLYADLNLASFTQSSPQPVTFSQMRALITPGNTDVKTALAEALAAPYQPAQGQSEDMVSFEKIRNWVASHIEYALDKETHDTEDYWQTPTETLNLGKGDCEDLAILLVSLLRAYGAPDGQVFVAVGSGPNNNWHAYVLEKYYYGIWRILDVEYARVAYFLEAPGGDTYKTSYCFNDKRSLRGLPSYPPKYIVPGIPDTTSVSPINITITFTGVPRPTQPTLTTNLPLASLTTQGPLGGKYWQPSYIPSGYTLSRALFLTDSEIILLYEHPWGSPFYLFEYPYSGEMYFPSDMVHEATVRGGEAWIVTGDWGYLYSLPNRTRAWSRNMDLNLYCNLDGWIITVKGVSTESWSVEELIKIAESLQLTS